jgi:hypothetical protein
VEKEQLAMEWAAIRSLAKWAQIEGRMSGEFFFNVSVASTNMPIQLLQDVTGDFYQILFTSQGASPDCHTARGVVWAQVPKVVTSEMNNALTSPINIKELWEAMHSLPIGKAMGPDGFRWISSLPYGIP